MRVKQMQILPTLATATAMAMLAACSTQPQPVRCDWRLVPINEPVAVKGNAAQSVSPRKESQPSASEPR